MMNSLKQLIPRGGGPLRQMTRLCSAEAAAAETDMPAGRTVRVRAGDRSVNEVRLMGNIGRQPELRGTTGKSHLLLTLGTSDTLRLPGGELQKNTQWHRVVVFQPGMQAYCKDNINVGDKVYVSGSLSYFNYTKDDGSIVKISSVKAEDIIKVRASKRTEDQPEPNE